MDDRRQSGLRAWPRMETPRDLLQLAQNVADPQNINESSEHALVSQGPILVPMNHMVADPERDCRLEKIE